MREGWGRVGFDDIATTQKIATKIQQKAYLPPDEGRVPVVDQGADRIGGYTDDLSAALALERPVVVFGDHTCIVKFIDFPFAPGADGTKVLVPRKGVDPYWLFLALQNLNLRPQGYARHFSYIRRAQFDLPPLPEQRRIVDLIGAVDAQIEAAERASSAIDELLRAAGNHYWTRHPERTTLRQLGALVTGATPSTKRAEYWDADDVPFVCPADFTKFMIADAERWVSTKGADAVRRLPPFSVLQVCIGSVGKVGVTDRDVVTNQQVNALTGLSPDEAIFVGSLLAAPAGQHALIPLTGLTTLPIVKKSAWGNLSIPWPHEHVRAQASAAFGNLYSSKRAVDREITATRRVRSALLSDLLSGDHEIPASYDRLLAA